MTCHRLAVASAVAERTERRVCAVDAGGSPKRKVLGGERFQRTQKMLALSLIAMITLETVCCTKKSAPNSRPGRDL